MFPSNTILSVIDPTALHTMVLPEMAMMDIDTMVTTNGGDMVIVEITATGGEKDGPGAAFSEIGL